MIRALHRDGQPTGEPVALPRRVGGMTNLAVAEGTTCLFTRVVGGGLEAIAVELAERRGLTLEHARGWLRHVGLATPLERGRGRRPEIVGRRPHRPARRRPPRSPARSATPSTSTTPRSGSACVVQRAVLTGAAAVACPASPSPRRGARRSRSSPASSPARPTPASTPPAHDRGRPGRRGGRARMRAVNLIPAERASRRRWRAGKSGGGVYILLGGPRPARRHGGRLGPRRQVGRPTSRPSWPASSGRPRRRRPSPPR